MPTINATVYPDEAYVLVQTDWAGTAFRDTFQRISATNWTPADTGQAYTIAAGVAANFSIDGSQGIISHAAAATNRWINSSSIAADVTFKGKFTSASVPAGGALTVFGITRFTNINNFTFGGVQMTSGGVTVIAGHVAAGVGNSSGFVSVALPTSGVYRFTLQTIGDQVRFRAWLDGTPEPMTWQTTFTTTILAAGGVGIQTDVAAGVTTPMPILFLIDDLVAYDATLSSDDCAIVTRRNTVTGETVTLRPYVFYNADGALMLECGQGLWWDTEPPLNVPLEYCTFGCDQPVTITANPDFDSSVAGWTATAGVLAQDCAVAKVGTCSGSFTPTGSFQNPSISQAGTTLAAEVPVIISTWAMSPQGWNSVFLRLAVVYDDFTTANIDTPMVTLDDNEWRYLQVLFTPEKPVTSFTFSFIMAGQPPNTTLFKVDDLKVSVMTPVTTSACETVTVASESVWLKNPLHPCLDVEVGLCSPMLADCEETARVSYVGTFEDSYEPNTVLLSPVNRQYAIPINRIRRAPSAVLRLLAHDCDARDAVLEINEPGDPLLFQAPADYCIPDRYISVRTLSETRISVDQREDFRLMTLPYVVVERPAGPADGVCGARIEDLCDIYTSWGALAMAGLTWEDLLLGNASPDGPGQPAPPEGARTWGDVETEFADWLAVEAGGTRDWGELRDGL